MRIRTIKPEFFKDEELATLEPIERLLFIGLWSLADANGVLEWRPLRIKAEVLPYDVLDVSQVLPRLVLGRWVGIYEVEGKPYLAIRNWHRHQRINGKEAKSGGRYPIPPPDLWDEKQPGSTREAPGMVPGAQEQGTGNREQGTGNGEVVVSDDDDDDRSSTSIPSPYRRRRRPMDSSTGEIGK